MRSKILCIILFHSLISFSTTACTIWPRKRPGCQENPAGGNSAGEALLWRDGRRFVDQDNGNSSSTSRSVAITAPSAAAEEQEAESSSSRCRRGRRMCLPRAIPMSGAGVSGSLHSQPQGQGQPSRSVQQGRNHSSNGCIFVLFYYISAFRMIACSG